MQQTESLGLKPPRGPKGSFLLGNLGEFRKGWLEFFENTARQYGDYVPIRFGPRRAVLLNHPDLIEEVLVGKAKLFKKHYALRLTQTILGNGLLLSENDFWQRQRKLAQPAFHRQRIQSYVQTMEMYTQQLVNSWGPNPSQRDIHEDMMRLTLRIAAKTLFDQDVEQEEHQIGRALETALEVFNERLNSILPVPDFIPIPRNVRMLRAVKQLDQIVYPMIEARRKSGEDRSDLLSMLLKVRDESDGTGMTDRQVRDEIVTFLLAGHETTAISLTWTFYLLSNQPVIVEKILAEIREKVGDEPLTLDRVSSLKYIDAVVKESMRVYPPAWIIGREAKEDCQIGGHPLRKGTTIYASQWVVHHDPRFFPQPMEFQPERWLTASSEKLPKYAYFPFGGGPRICIGNAFAMMEAVVILANVLKQVRVEVEPGYVPEPHPSVTLRPKAGMPVRIQRRTY